MTPDLDALLRAGGVAVGLVFLLVVAIRAGWRRRADLLAVIACALAYLVCSAPAQACSGSPAALPVVLGAIAFPFAFWRLSRVVLEDEALVPWYGWAGLAVLLASGLLAAGDYLQAPPTWRLVAGGLNKLAAFGFVGAALYVLWRSWDGDLVEPRRRLRRILLGYLGLYAMVILTAEVYLFGGRPPAWVDLLNVTAIDATLLATLVWFVQPRAAAMEALFAAPAAAPDPPARLSPASPAANTEPLVERLRDLMEVQRLYRDPELTVRVLAGRAGVPEYVLRRLIHERLGHRNFASYVNELRLREVAERLLDPQLARRPILTLALEAGFGSIGPFNRAFRARHGVTPSQYRTGLTGATGEEASEATV